MADSFEFETRDDEAMRFLFGVCQRDPGARAKAIQRVQDSVESWIDGYGSPPVTTHIAGPTGILNGVGKRAFLQDLLPGILRLSLKCPFDDVREKFTELLTDIEVCNNTHCLNFNRKIVFVCMRACMCVYEREKKLIMKDTKKISNLFQVTFPCLISFSFLYVCTTFLCFFF